MRYKKSVFTVIEMLFSVSIIAILAALLMPNLIESRQRARYTRWLQFNKQCSNDPSCVININFQDGEGNILKNSAYGYEGENFDASKYNGTIYGDFEWTQGRWHNSKKALQFDGVSTYVKFLESQHINFTSTDGMTIIIWVKFDTLENFSGLFSKCLPQKNKAVAETQYAIYYKGTQKSPVNTSVAFQMNFDGSLVNYNSKENYDHSNWTMIAMRNTVSDGKRYTDIFFNGRKLGAVSSQKLSEEIGSIDTNLTLGCVMWYLETGAQEAEGIPGNFLKGKIDEFLVFKRPLSDREILGHYEMGAERG